MRKVNLTEPLRYVAKGTETTGDKYTASLLQSMGANDKYKLVILANLPDYGFLYGLYGKTYAEVQQACLSAESLLPLVFDSTHPFPMFGVGQWRRLRTGTGKHSIHGQYRTDSCRCTRGPRHRSKNTNPDGTVTWNKNNVPFTMTEIQVWKTGKRYTYIPAVGNFHWTTTSNDITSNNIVMDSPTVVPGETVTMTYNSAYITDGTYCADRIYLPEADLLWGSTFDDNHANRLAIIVGGRYDGSAMETFYRIDFTYDEGSKDKMNILRNHVYQFTIKRVEAAGYATAELAYNSKPKNLSFEVAIEPWTVGQTASVPSILGYYLSYQGFNGENVDWTYAVGSSRQIPKKKSYWGTNQYLSFDYDNFYKEGNSFYASEYFGRTKREVV